MCLDLLENPGYTVGAGDAARVMATHRTEYGIPWRAARQPPARYTDLSRSSSSGCVTSRGNCCFYQDLVQAPRLGGVPSRGSTYRRAVATVARWSDPGHANGEE